MRWSRRSICRTVTLIALREMTERGTFINTADGRVASAATLALLKSLAAERQAVQALGIDRRAAPATSLDAYLAALKSGAAKSGDAVPAEVVSVTEQKA